MWQDKLKEIIYILENSDVNEIEATFWGRKFWEVNSVVRFLFIVVQVLTFVERRLVSLNHWRVKDLTQELSRRTFLLL